MGNRSIICSICCAAMCFTSIAATNRAQDSITPDVDERAATLLQGVRNARISLRTGKVRVHEIRTFANGDAKEEFTYHIEWKDNRIRVAEMHGDKEGNRAIRNGADQLYFRNKEAGLTDARGRYALHVFDPRLLGAFPVLTSGQDIGVCLFPQESKWQPAIRSIAAEQNGHKCEVIELTIKGGRREYWIEDTAGFPVRKLIDYNNSSTIESDYGSGEILPLSVTEIRRTGDGAVVYTKQFTIERLPSGSIDDSRFEMSGLELDIGQRFADQRKGQIVGFWNGTGLSPTYEDAFTTLATQEIPAVVDSSWSRIALIVINAVSLLTILGVYLFRRRGGPANPKQ